MALSICQVKLLIALNQLPLKRSEDLDPSEWESAKGIENRHREFIAGCEDAAIGKIERTTS
ncbi:MULTISPECIES: hypothetical protein [Streptomyces]|uniref:hypothetical protein n=1 Tax=Streptomyces TaxID=1883 RepID=UPI0013DBCFEC